MNAPGRPSPRVLRAALAGLTVFGYGAFALFPGALFPLGINHLGVWFLDTFALLASNDAVARGLDPYAANPLDYLQRPHIYSHWWLNLRHLGLTRADNLWLGLLFGALFLGAALAWLRPRSWGELAWCAVILLSPPMLLGFSRANNDLLIFALLLAVIPALRASDRRLRWLAIVPVALAAGLKFYPAVAGIVLAAGDDRREIRKRLLLAAAVVGVVMIDVMPDAMRVAPLLPRAEGLMSFGAFNLLDAFGATGNRGRIAGVGLASLAVMGFRRLDIFAGWKPAGHESAWLGFVLGAAVLTACFLTGANYAYRWVFAVALAPLAWRLWHDEAAPRLARRFAMVTSVLLLAVLWLDPFASLALNLIAGQVPPMVVMQWANDFYLLEQPVTWVFFWCLLGFLTHFTTGALRTVRGA